MRKETGPGRMAVKWTADNITRLSDMYYNMGLEKAGVAHFSTDVMGVWRTRVLPDR